MKDLVDKLEAEMKENNGVVRPLHLVKIMSINFMVVLCFGPDCQDENFVNELEELIAEGDREGGEGKKRLSEEEIVFNLFEIFILSMDRMSTAVEWALAYMIRHPDVQRKVHEETREAVSGDNTECVVDLEKLPFWQL
ncbi:hypothetical protein KI387_024583, partial [Taxus chinensis]